MKMKHLTRTLEKKTLPKFLASDLQNNIQIETGENQDGELADPVSDKTIPSGLNI